MDNVMQYNEKQTVETLAESRGITRQAAINLLSKLKKRGYVSVSGGGRQKRIYTITKLPQNPTNGFFDTVNKYADDKLVPQFMHYVHGRYAAEDAIIDGLLINDSRTREATKALFLHVTNWQRLFALARKKNLQTEVRDLYEQARKTQRVRRMPKRYA
jgi:DNA-binding Lrp family transcriptional regulator